jgi:hypothetical protein
VSTIRRGATPLDRVAVGWGGLAASVGLMAGAGRDWPARLAASAASFLLGGLLAGVRAGGRRRLHALCAGVLAYVIDAAFVAAAAVIDGIGGPNGPDLFPGGLRDWVLAAVWSLGFALVGGIIADGLLRPAGARGNRTL